MQQLLDWHPDVVALSEFRGTPPSQAIASALAAHGLVYQRTTVDRDKPAINALLVASRWAMRRVQLRAAPVNRHRWLHVNIAADKPFALMAIHIPNRTTGLKYRFMDSIVELIGQWRGPPALVIGDTNSGRIDIDEQASTFNRTEDGWLCTLDDQGWRDGFRWLHGDAREYTWYSPNGRNGFRLDQAFVHPQLLPRLRSLRHCWGGFDGGGRCDALSDHAALVLDFSAD